MESFIEVISTFPVVVFTALLLFSLLWSIVSMIVGGLDGDVFDIDFDEPDGLSDDLGFGTVPLSIAILVLSAIGWLVSIALSSAAHALGLSGSSLLAAAIGVLVVSCVAGLFAARRVAKLIAPLYETLVAPSVETASGSHARVRSVHLDSSGGEVIVIDGPVSSTILAARATGSQVFDKDAIVVIGDRDAAGVWTVTRRQDSPR